MVHHNGQPVFVPGTAPGDVVTGRICLEKGTWAKAELLTLEKASPYRVEPVCPLYGQCGGCNLQHIQYEAQLKIKTDILKEVFHRIGKTNQLPEIRINPSNPLEYRNRMQFHRLERTKQGKTPLGLKGRESHTIIPVEDCPVADPGIRCALREHRITCPVSKDRFTIYARNGILLTEGGTEQASLDFMNKKISMDAGVFFQSNGMVLEKMLKDLIHTVKDLPAKQQMADFYCGVGTFAVFLQDYFEKIDLLEENKKALALARRNLAGREAGYYALKDDQWVSLMGKKTRPYDFIVIDPPRQGLSSAMRGWLCEKGPPRLAYVSCDPATLARDTYTLIQGGYVLKDIGFYDFYPQTAHIESLVTFVREGVRP